MIAAKSHPRPHLARRTPRPATRRAGRKLVPGFFGRSPPTRAQSPRSQVAEPHQANRLCGYDFAPGRVVAPNKPTPCGPGSGFSGYGRFASPPPTSPFGGVRSWGEAISAFKAQLTGLWRDTSEVATDIATFGGDEFKTEVFYDAAKDYIVGNAVILTTGGLVGSLGRASGLATATTNGWVEAGYYAFQQGGGRAVIGYTGTFTAEQGAIATGQIASQIVNSQLTRIVIAADIVGNGGYAWLANDGSPPSPTPGGLIGFGLNQIASPEAVNQLIQDIKSIKTKEDVCVDQ